MARNSGRLSKAQLPYPSTVSSTQPSTSRPPLSHTYTDARSPSARPSNIGRRSSMDAIKSIFTRQKSHDIEHHSNYEDNGLPRTVVTQSSLASKTVSHINSTNDAPVEPSASPSLSDSQSTSPSISPSPFSERSSSEAPQSSVATLTPYLSPSSSDARLSSQLSENSMHPKPAKVSSRDSLVPPKLSVIRSARTDAAWNTLELYQAYRQAFKHAVLSAPTLSADSLLKLTPSQRMQFFATDVPAQLSIVAANRADKSHQRRPAQISGHMPPVEWTQKIFVLITSGYLLQYAGFGRYDRLPEKVLQLGKDSVAFASDVIPGKHWVLQVSQFLGANGASVRESRSFFSKLFSGSPEQRRPTTCLLLVLDSADELESWLNIVRQTIEALGGKRRVTETGKLKEAIKLLPNQEPQPPQRAPFEEQHPDCFDNPRQLVDGSLGGLLTPASKFFDQRWSRLEPSKPEQDFESGWQLDFDANQVFDDCSVSESRESQDGATSKSLKANENRYSATSTFSHTKIASQNSSTTSSPSKRASFLALGPEQAVNILPVDARPRPNAIAISQRRQSVQQAQQASINTMSLARQPSRPRPHSICPEPNAPMSSAENDSSPKRSSMIYPTSPSKIFDFPSPPESPSSSIYSTTHEPLRISPRRPPPPVFHTSLHTRTLSPVWDIPSPTRQSLDQAADGWSDQSQSGLRKIVIRKSALLEPNSTNLPLVDQRASVLPAKRMKTEGEEHRTPKKYSSMQTIRQTPPHCIQDFQEPSPSTPSTSGLLTPVKAPNSPTPKSKTEANEPVQASTKDVIYKYHQFRSGSLAPVTDVATSPSAQVQRSSNEQVTHDSPELQPFLLQSQTTLTTSTTMSNTDLSSTLEIPPKPISLAQLNLKRRPSRHILHRKPTRYVLTPPVSPTKPVPTRQTLHSKGRNFSRVLATTPPISPTVDQTQTRFEIPVSYKDRRNAKLFAPNLVAPPATLQALRDAPTPVASQLSDCTTSARESHIYPASSVAPGHNAPTTSDTVASSNPARYSVSSIYSQNSPSTSPSKAKRSSLILPSLQKLKDSARPKGLAGRRSMPQLLSTNEATDGDFHAVDRNGHGTTAVARGVQKFGWAGPPSMPPPDYALPPLPGLGLGINLSINDLERRI